VPPFRFRSPGKPERFRLSRRTVAVVRKKLVCHGWRRLFRRRIP